MYTIYLYVDPAIWSHLQKRFEREWDSNIRDVMDGCEYKKQRQFLSEPGNVSLLMNTDGVSMFKSSNVSLWPIWVAINELPPHVRLAIPLYVLYIHVHVRTYSMQIPETQLTSCWVVVQQGETDDDYILRPICSGDKSPF